ncbi:MAG: hypothetical protein ACI9UN_005454, partial [Granulosicoccus sp.]
HKHYLPVFTNPAAATYVCAADGRASESGESGIESTDAETLASTRSQLP